MNGFFKKKQGLREGAAVLLLASAIVKLIGALFKIPLSSEAVLGDLGFGYFSLVYDIYSPISALAISGIPVAISRVVADYNARECFFESETAVKVSKRFFCRIGFLFSLVMFIFVMLSIFFGGVGDGAYALLAVVPAFPVCFWVSVKRGRLEGMQNMSCAALSSVTEALGKLVLGLGLAVIVLKITENTAYAAAAAIVGIGVGMLLSGAILLPFDRTVQLSKKSVNQSGKTEFEREILKTVIPISVPVVLASLSGSAATLIDALTVKRLISDTLSDGTAMYSQIIGEYGGELLPGELSTLLYGIRSKAHTLYNLVPTLTLGFGISSIPVITEAVNRKDSAETESGVFTVLKLSSFIAFPAAAGLISLGEPIMCLLYGESFSSAVGGKMLAIYGIAALLAGIMLPVACVLQAFGKQKAVLFNATLSVAVKLAFNFALCRVPLLNVYGAVISTVLYCFTYCTLNLVVLIKATGLGRGLITAMLKPFAAAVLCGIIAYTVSLSGNSALSTVTAVILAAAVYFAVLFFFERMDCGKKIHK